MRNPPQREDLEPWYRQFWPWVLIGIPATTVVAGIATVWLATREPVALVHDDYYKQGLSVNRDLAKHRAALALGQQAQLAFDPATGQVSLRLDGDSQPETLSLALVHPVAIQRDREITLRREGDSQLYTGPAALDPERWYLELEGGESGDRWRLTGEIDLRQSRLITLLPTP